MFMAKILLILAVIAFGMTPGHVTAQESRLESHCLSLADIPGVHALHKASFTDAVPVNAVRIR